MDEIIIKSLQARTSPEEEARLRAWRLQSPDNDRLYRTLSRIWVVTGAAAPAASDAPPALSDVLATAPFAEGAAGRQGRRVRVVGRDDQIDAPVGVTTSPWLRRAAAGALAASLVAVGLGLGLTVAQEQNDDSAMLAESETVTGPGEMTTLTLADGSSIRLGPQSRLRLSDGRVRRLAWLEGRAFFGVEADSTRPFVVRTPSGNATALGTRFEVNTEDEFRVLVVEGRVSVTAGGAQVAVAGGEMSRSVGGGPPATEMVEDVYQHLEWLGDAVVFSATPLERVVEELERQYGAEITIADSALRELAVTAAFTGRPIEEVIVVICEAISAECDVEGDGIRIRARSADGR